MIQSKQMSSFNPSLNLVEEGKWLLGVTLFDCKNSVFNINKKKQIVFNHYTRSLGVSICRRNY